jgi:hypothetical protein
MTVAGRCLGTFSRPSPGGVWGRPPDSRREVPTWPGGRCLGTSSRLSQGGAWGRPPDRRREVPGYVLPTVAGSCQHRVEVTRHLLLGFPKSIVSLN